MQNDLLISTLCQVAHGISVTFGNNCEVVVHDLRGRRHEKSIVMIENGHVSGRVVGDGPSRPVLETLKADPSKLEDKLSYLTKTRDGKILKCSTMYFRDDSGKVTAILAINFDITMLQSYEAGISQLISTFSGNKDELEPENIQHNVNDLLDELIDQSVRLVGKPVTAMTKDDKVRAIQFLNNAGAFLIMKSGDKVSKFFGISKYTLYSYIDAGKTSA